MHTRRPRRSSVAKHEVEEGALATAVSSSHPGRLAEPFDERVPHRLDARNVAESAMSDQVQVVGRPTMGGLAKSRCEPDGDQAIVLGASLGDQHDADARGCRRELSGEAARANARLGDPGVSLEPARRRYVRK